MIGGMNRALILVNVTPDEPVVLDRGGWGPEEPVEGVDITRPICRCKFAQDSGSELGQAGCSAPSAGGSGSAEFGTGDNTAKSGGPDLGTIAVVGVVGLGALYLLGII
jgi:hypothetical protein